MIDTVIFDLEGVIVDTEVLWDAANRRFLEMHGATYNRAAIKPLIAGRSLPDGTRIIRETFKFSEPLETLVAQRKAIVEQELREGADFLPGFLEFYASVSGFKSCIATSMNRELLAIVDRQLDLSSMFPGRLFTIADVGYVAKPDPALFLHAARQLGSSPESCVVIEDAPTGIRAARNAGMRSIGLASTFEPALLTEADRVVQSFAEIDLSTLSTPGAES